MALLCCLSSLAHFEKLSCGDVFPSSRFSCTTSFLSFCAFCAEPEVGVGSLLYIIHSFDTRVSRPFVIRIGCGGAHQIVHCACAHRVYDVKQKLQYEHHQKQRRHGSAERRLNVDGVC